MRVGGGAGFAQSGELNRQPEAHPGHSRVKTSNIQHRTPNAEPIPTARQRTSMLDVGCFRLMEGCGGSVGSDP